MADPACPGACPAAPAAAENPWIAPWVQVVANGAVWVARGMLAGVAVQLLNATVLLAGMVVAVGELALSTPEEWTVDLVVPPLGRLADVQAALASACAAVLVVVIAGRLALALATPQRRATPRLVAQLLLGVVVLAALPLATRTAIRVANALSAALIADAFGRPVAVALPVLAIPDLDPSAGFSLTVTLALLAHWGALLLLAPLALLRIAAVNLLLVVSPIVALSIALGGSWRYAQVWCSRFAEALLLPALWGIALALAAQVATALIGGAPGASDSASESARWLLLAAFAYLVVPRVGALVGLDHAAVAAPAAAAATAAAAAAGMRRAVADAIREEARIRREEEARIRRAEERRRRAEERRREHERRRREEEVAAVDDRRRTDEARRGEDPDDGRRRRAEEERRREEEERRWRAEEERRWRAEEDEERRRADEERRRDTDAWRGGEPDDGRRRTADDRRIE